MRARIFWMLLLATACPAPGWGPFTHARFNERALSRLKDYPDLAFLAKGKHSAIFVTASSVCDLTFNVLAMGKTRKDYNKLLHNFEFLDHLLKTAAWKNDLEALAFALALRSHAIADVVGNRGTGMVPQNTFRWPMNRDFHGVPTQDADSTAREQLKKTTTNLNKILIDSMLYAGRRTECSYAPVVDDDLLIEAISSYSGAYAVPHTTDAEMEQIRSDIHDLSWKYKMSFQVLESTVRKLAENAGLQKALRKEFEVTTDQDIENANGCIDRIIEELAYAMTRLQLRPSCADPDSDTAWCGSESTSASLLSLSQSILSAAWTLPQSYVSAGGDRDDDSLEDLHRRVYLTFFSAIAEPDVPWMTVRERIRKLVPTRTPKKN